MGIMKTSLKLFLTVLVAMAVFSCAKETEVNTDAPLAKKTITLTATVDDNIIDATETKTYLDGLNILWNDDEVVKAYGIYSYDSETRTVSGDKKKADFTFDIEDGDEIHYAIYPAANAAGADEEHMEVTIPTEQIATADSFDPDAMVAIGRVQEGGKIAFMNVGALLSIVINNDDIESVEITATEANTESMTGTADIEIDGSDNIATVTDGLTTSVKLTGGLNNGETYYFVVYPGTYSNLRIVVTDTDGAIAVYRNKKTFTVARNENWKIADLTIPAGKWVPASVETDFFYESFDGFTGNANNVGGNDDQWSDINPSGTKAYDNDGWDITSPGGADRCLKTGAKSTVGTATTPAFTGIGEGTKDVTISFKAAEWTGDGTDLTLSITGGGTLGKTAFTMGSEEWATLSTTITGATSSTKVTFTPTKRMFLDEVRVTGTASRDDSPQHYTVTYDANGATSGDAPSDATDYNDQTDFIVTVAGVGELVKTGYSFTGWNTRADGSGTSYAAGATFVISGNVTLYAQWEAIVYTITKNTNAHCAYTVKAGGVEVSEAIYGTSLTLEADTPDLGYVFNKFHIDYTKPDSTPGESNFTVNPKAYTMPASNITITLMLDEVDTYTVTWKVGATTYHTDILTAGDVLALPSNPVPAEVGYDGKTFMGWTTAVSVNADGTSITYAQNDDAVSADVTYHAVFASGSATPASLAEVSSSYTLTVGDELVIVANDGSTDYGLYEETINSSYVKNFEFTNSASDIAGNAKKHWTVSKVSDNYYLGDSTNGYLYTSGSNNLASNTSSKSPVTLAYNSTEGKFTIVMNSRWLSLRNDLTGGNKNLWRMGGATSGSPSGVVYFKIYKFTPASGSFSDYTL